MTFPALVPSARTFTTGDTPQSAQSALSGVRTSFRRGSRRIGQTLSLSFGNLSETQLNLVKTHYIDRQGTFGFFFLEADVWSGYATPPIPLVSNYAWRYSEPPTISDGIVGKWAVDVELVTHPIGPGDLIIDGKTASDSVSRAYNVDGGSASGTPARDYLINSGLAA